jgi:hypothetical protein
VSAIVEELRLLATWGERHRRLGTRLLVVLALSVVVDIAGMVATYFFERGVKGGEIHTLWDAFFFSTVQLLTALVADLEPVHARWPHRRHRARAVGGPRRRRVGGRDRRVLPERRPPSLA